MSQIKPSHLIISMAMAFAMAGCGDKNPQAVFSESHPEGWSTSHKVSAKSNLENCVECHGEELDGGISKVSCSKCHLGTNGAIHPEQWGSYAYARHKASVNAQKSATNPDGTSKCANAACHGTNLGGVTGSGPACATKCHLESSLVNHRWAQSSSHRDYVNSNTNDKCKNASCHGSDLKGVFLSGQSCTMCHLGGNSAVHPATAGSWRNADHQGYTLAGQTNAQTRAKCDIVECHGTYNDAAKPGMIKISKTCAAGSCHAGDKN